MCPHPRGQSAIAPARSENAIITSAGAMWASPKDRIPGVSITHPPNSKGKATDCVEVCPVDCFYEGENMLVIHPDECIDCGVCEPECPVEAIKPDTEPDLEKWLDVNRDYAEKWPNITAKKDAPPDADDFIEEKGKFDKYFSANPGEGD